MPIEFKYNHEVWFKYSLSSLGFDIYRAKFEASLPRHPIKFAVGKWFIDARFFRWQILINKLTNAQLNRMQLAIQQDKNETDGRFDNPSFGF
jgi:hypothetical protein